MKMSWAILGIMTGVATTALAEMGATPGNDTTQSNPGAITRDAEVLPREYDSNVSGASRPTRPSRMRQMTSTSTATGTGTWTNTSTSTTTATYTNTYGDTMVPPSNNSGITGDMSGFERRDATGASRDGATTVPPPAAREGRSGMEVNPSAGSSGAGAR